MTGPQTRFFRLIPALALISSVASASDAGAAQDAGDLPFVREDKVEVKGNYMGASVSPVLHERFGDIAKCYAASMKAERHRQLTIGVTFMITRRGTMSRLEGAGDSPQTGQQAQELSCTVQALSGMSFPPPPEMVSVTASILVTNDPE